MLVFLITSATTNCKLKVVILYEAEHLQKLDLPYFRPSKVKTMENNDDLKHSYTYNNQFLHHLANNVMICKYKTNTKVNKVQF